MSIAVLGAGAFGTALAISLASDGRAVTLWARDPDIAQDMQKLRENAHRLPGHTLPRSLGVTSDLTRATAPDILLLAMPMQSLGTFLHQNRTHLASRRLVACCKGIDLASGHGPTGIITAKVPTATPALLSGPSFAVDIAAGLPTALTLATAQETTATNLQTRLSTANLRLYRSTDTTGVELGGALKNVIAIACGITIGAQLGESARAALMTRGYAEMLRFALHFGARPETLSGLSGLGDLALTCTSEKSRNFSFGLRLGAAGQANPTATTEGIATARAVADLARKHDIDMPIATMIAAVLAGDLTVSQATQALLTRPLKPE
jgi:glycerol-3-phosphate dehydrogenase (NAD(P)+)